MSKSHSDPKLGARLKELGISAGHASDIANGKSLPSLALAVRIEDAIGIPPRYWVKREDASESEAAHA